MLIHSIIVEKPRHKIDEAMQLLRKSASDNPRGYESSKIEIEHILYILNNALNNSRLEIEEMYYMDFDVILWLRGETSDFDLLFQGEYL